MFLEPPLFELARILAKAFLALLAGKGHLKALQQRMVGRLLVALGAVEPFPACVCHYKSRQAEQQTSYSRASGWRLGR